VIAESAIPVVRVRCGECGRHVGTAYHVRGYRHREEIFTPEGQSARETVIDDGFVVTGQWHDTTAKRGERPASIPLEWPVVDADLLIVCPTHGYLVLTAEQVTTWGHEAATARRRVDRVASQRGG
jgi:hypothetical protein